MRVALPTRGRITVCVTGRTAFGMQSGVKYVFQPAPTDRLHECSCVVVGGALLSFVAIVARRFSVTGRASLPVEIPLRHVLLRDEIGIVEARGVTSMAFGACLCASHGTVVIVSSRNSDPHRPTT